LRLPSLLFGGEDRYNSWRRYVDSSSEVDNGCIRVRIEARPSVEGEAQFCSLLLATLVVDAHVDGRSTILLPPVDDVCCRNE